jgi:hypothetical protein
MQDYRDVSKGKIKLLEKGLRFGFVIEKFNARTFLKELSVKHKQLEITGLELCSTPARAAWQALAGRSKGVFIYLTFSYYDRDYFNNQFN